VVMMCECLTDVTLAEIVERKVQVTAHVQCEVRGGGCLTMAVGSRMISLVEGGPASDSLGTVIGRSQYGQSVTRPPNDPAARKSSPHFGQVKEIRGRWLGMEQPVRRSNLVLPP